MATEPERRIEQLLRAYAQKRREEAPERFELHPVNRRLLQDEVARLRNETPSSFSWLQAIPHFWKQIALACSILVALGVVLWSTNPWQNRPQEIALKSDNDSLDRKELNEPAPARKLEDKPALETPAKAKGAELAKALPLKEALAPGNAPAVPEAKSRFAGEREMTRESERSPTTAPKTDSATLAGALAEGNIASPAPPAPVQRRSSRMQLAEPPGETPRISTDAPKLAAAPSARPAPSTAPMGAAAGGYGGAGAAGNRLQKPAVGAELADGVTLRSPVDATQSRDKKEVEEALNLLLSKQNSQPTSGASSFAFGRGMESNSSTTGAPDNLHMAFGGAAPSAPQTTVPDLARKDDYAASPVREQFASVPDTEISAERAKTSAPVLDSFVLERTGDQVKIIDADGSVYEGQLLAGMALNGIAKDERTNVSLDTLARDTATRQRGARSASAVGRSLNEPVTFRASGMSKTLQQQIEITATLNAPVALTAAKGAPSTLGVTMKSPATRGGRAGGGPSFGAPARSVPSAPSADARKEVAPPSNAVSLEGTARIGTRPMPLKAVRVSK